MPPSGDGPTPSGNRRSLFVVLSILAVLLIIAAGLGVYALASSDDDAASNQSDELGGGPTAVIPTDDLPTDDLPTDGLPTDLTDLPELPTEGGPSEQQYVETATSFAEAIRDGDCETARTFMSDTYNESISDADLCRNEFNGPQLADDDFSDYELETFGTIGAAVTFDDANTYVGLSAQSSGEPLVDMFFAF